MTAPRSCAFVAAALSGALVLGCGSGGASKTGSTPPSAARSGASGSAGSGGGTQAMPTPVPTGVPASPAAVKVIREWSDALRNGDVSGAASFFALPSQFVNGAGSSGQLPVIAIRTRAEAEAINATLPCGARFISADQRGPYVNALFRLTDRPGLGGGCGAGIGQLARTNFVIAGGRIVRWIRAPDDPADSYRGRAPQVSIRSPRQSEPTAI